MEVSPDYAVQMHDITKVFGSFKALDAVELNVRKQTVHAILGENGAGKSTLMNVLYGLYSADEGEVYLNGERVSISGPNDAIAHGIGMVHQHFMLVENFTVTENIVLGNEVTKGGGVLDPKRAREKVLEIVEEYGFDVDPDAKIEDISVGMQQRVEILKALYRGAEILILDEPTAVLTPQEIEKLIQIMHDLVSKGKTIIVITHKLKEIMSSADECTIIRRGKYMSTVDVSKTSETELATLMVGRNVNLHVEKKPATPGEVVLSIKDLHVRDERGIEQVNGFNLDIRAGEIVGLAGIVGAGRSEMATTIYGMDKVLGGKVFVDGKDITGKSTKDVIAAGLSYVPEDRFNDGLFRIRDVAENTTSALLANSSLGKLLLNRKEEDRVSQNYVDNFRTKVTGLDQEVGGLSGGNQQKIVIGRAFSVAPKVVILDEPTRGIDAAARGDVYAVLQELRKQGVSILLISSDMEEIIELADRAFTMHRGRINHEFKKSDITQDNLMSAAFGL